jgi:hypothetical protein
MLVATGLFGGQSLRAPAAPELQPIDVNLVGNKIGPQGFALDRTGDTLAVHLVWLAWQPMAESHTVFIQVADNQSQQLAQTDSRPQRYAGNTNR